MKQSNFTLGFIITLLSSLSFGFICFLGVIFFTLGNINESIITGLTISILLCVTSLGSSKLKQTNKNFKTCFVWEIILLIMFTGLTVFFAYTIFPHYFVVNKQSVKIQNKLNASIRKSKNIFIEYEKYANERKLKYKDKLESVALNHELKNGGDEYRNYEFKDNGLSNKSQIINKMDMMQLDLFPHNYKNIKEADLSWINQYEEIIKDWEKKPISIIDVINNIEKKSKLSVSQLVSFSTIREKNEVAIDFSGDLIKAESVKNHFTTPGGPTPLSLCLAVLLYLMMLLSWFTSKREINGGKTASYEVVL